jgi:hypothetical protein
MLAYEFPPKIRGHCDLRQISLKGNRTHEFTTFEAEGTTELRLRRERRSQANDVDLLDTSIFMMKLPNKDAKYHF